MFFFCCCFVSGGRSSAGRSPTASALHRHSHAASSGSWASLHVKTAGRRGKDERNVCGHKNLWLTQQVAAWLAVAYLLAGMGVQLESM